MASVIVPITPNTNQTISVTLPVNGGNITLNFSFTYNTPGGYWFMTISDKSNVVLLDAIPLVTGAYPAANLLRQYGYMNIGSAYILPASSTTTGIPSFDNLGTEFYLVWTDNEVTP